MASAVLGRRHFDNLYRGLLIVYRVQKSRVSFTTRLLCSGLETTAPISDLVVSVSKFAVRCRRMLSEKHLVMRPMYVAPKETCE